MDEFTNIGQYYKEIAKFPRLPKAEIDKLWRRVKKGNLSAKNKLVEMYLPLVLPIAKKYKKSGLEFLDLVEEGNIGLIHAIEKYNPRKRVRLSTYAAYWIEQYIRRSVEERSKTIRIPPHIWDGIRKLLRIREVLHSKYGRPPTVGEISESLGIQDKQVKRLIDVLEIAQGVGSLEAPIDEEGELFIKDVITDKTSINPENLFAVLKLKGELNYALSKLNPRERKIIELRYGLSGSPQMILEDIGKQFNLSRERIRQIEKRGLYRLRWIAHKMKLIPDELPLKEK
ncbi:MAG: RNA polymerase sigma factor RpoD/SigA [Elusimicrobiota bacterium]